MTPFNGMVMCWACFEGTSSIHGPTTADCANCSGPPCQCDHQEAS